MQTSLKSKEISSQNSIFDSEWIICYPKTFWEKKNFWEIESTTLSFSPKPIPKSKNSNGFSQKKGDGDESITKGCDREHFFR